MQAAPEPIATPSELLPDLDPDGEMEAAIESFILVNPSRQVRRAAARREHRNTVNAIARGRARRRIRRAVAKRSLQRNRRG